MRLRRLLWFNAVFSITPVALFGGVVVEGRVELPKSHSAPVQAKRYEIVTKGGVLSTQPPLAVVYLDGPFPQPASLPTKQVAQKDLTFVPALLPIRVGSKVEFPNLDDTYHNIFSYSPAKRFDLGRYRPEERPVPVQVFDKPGLVTLRCDIHEHMRGLILVLNTPYFVMTDTDGRFRLSGLPAGHYTLKAWIDSRTTREKSVDLANGQTLHVDFP
jgi:plastocyanin